MEESAFIEDKKQQWNPYVDHGGTTLSICGDNYVLFAADTRLAESITILSRKKSRIFQVTPKCLIGTSGFQGDIEALITRIQNLVTNYRQNNFHEMSTEAIAHAISAILYSKRLFPYYVWVTVAGIGKDGKGVLYGYDPVGSYGTYQYQATGTGGTMGMGILDATFGTFHHGEKEFPYPDINTGKDILRNAMCSIATRDIMTGDYLEMVCMTTEGVTREEFELQHD